MTAPVTSPTFTIGHRYEGRVTVSHLDLYRFTSVSSAEWADISSRTSTTRSCSSSGRRRGRRHFHAARAAVTLELAGADRRRIALAAPEEALLQGIA